MGTALTLKGFVEDAPDAESALAWAGADCERCEAQPSTEVGYGVIEAAKRAQKRARMQWSHSFRRKC